MSGFYCAICKGNKDEVDHVIYKAFLNGKPVCDECHYTIVIIDQEIARGTIPEDGEISEEARMKGLEPLNEYLELRGKRRASDKERQEVNDLFGGSME